jgi:hypothetical protein
MADPTDDPRVRRRNIRYHLSQQGAGRVKASEDTENPMAANFMPLAERSERGRARWWALHGRRKRHENAEMDG